jgi:Ca2+-binding RTX toxin-like protein
VQSLGAVITKTDTFTVQSLDGTASQDIKVTINGVNDAPVAGIDALTATQGTLLTIPVANLLTNDSDVDTGDQLSITGVGNGSGGVVGLNNNGTPTNPNDDFIIFSPTSGGLGSFTYTLSDGKGGITPGTVDVLIGTRQLGGNRNDILIGNNGPDYLDGGNGRDNLFGSLGNDTLLGGNAEDLLLGEDGDDLLNGGNGEDKLLGGAGKDTILGGNGEDLLVGGKDGDVLTGGSSEDIFLYSSLSDSLLPDFDQITDLKIGTDRINAPTAIRANNIAKLGTVNSLMELDISAVLTGSSFRANRAATFSSGSRTFLALNDNIAGFQVSSDAIIEITGFSGNLNNLVIF